MVEKSGDEPEVVMAREGVGKERNRAVCEGVEERKDRVKVPKKTAKNSARRSKNVASKIKVVDDGAGKKIKKEEVERLENQTKIQDYWEPQGLREAEGGGAEQPIVVEEGTEEEAEVSRGRRANNKPGEDDSEAGGPLEEVVKEYWEGGEEGEEGGTEGEGKVSVRRTRSKSREKNRKKVVPTVTPQKEVRRKVKGKEDKGEAREGVMGREEPRTESENHEEADAGATADLVQLNEGGETDKGVETEGSAEEVEIEKEPIVEGVEDLGEEKMSDQTDWSGDVDGDQREIEAEDWSLGEDMEGATDEEEGEKTEWQTVGGEKKGKRGTRTDRHKARKKKKQAEWREVMQQGCTQAGEESEGSEGEDGRTEDESNESDVEGRLRERGRRMVDARDRIRTDMKVKIYDKRAEQKSGRRKMIELLEVMQREDQSAVLVVKGIRMQSEAEVPGGGEFSQRFSENRDREGNTYMRVALESRLKLNDMKWRGTGALMEWLKEERVMVQIDRWRTERARVVGCMLMVHPVHTWKEDYEEELKSQLESVEYVGYARNEWLQTVGKGKGTKVPDFQVVREKKYFGTGRSRVVTTVLNLESRLEDSMYLKELMRKATEQRKIRGAFIESGFHLTASSKRMLAVMRGQRKYLESRVGIPLMGLGEEVMQRIVEFEGKRAAVKSHLMTFLGAERVERSNQTSRLGKWLILTRKEKYGTTVRKIDTEIWRFLRGWMEEGDEVGGFPHPRRPNGPMIDCDHDAYLEQVEAVAGRVDEDSGVKGANQRKQREEDTNTGRFPGKKPRKTYVETARGSRSEVAGDTEVVPGVSEVDGESDKGMEMEVEEVEQENVAVERCDMSLEKLAEEMEEKMRSQLKHQEEQMGLLYEKSREETKQAMKAMTDRCVDQMVEDNMRNKQELLKNVDSMVGDIRKSIEQDREERKELQGIVMQLREEVAELRELKELKKSEQAPKDLDEVLAAVRVMMAEQRKRAVESEEEKKVKRARPGTQRGVTTRPGKNIQGRMGAGPQPRK